MITARNYAQNASSYGQGAQLLISNEDVDDILKPAFYLLVGFSPQLGLKSLSLSSGVDFGTVRSWGHNLTKALQSATECGHVPDHHTDLRLLVKTIGPLHEKLLFRYTPAEVSVLHVPPPLKCVKPLIHLTVRATRAAWNDATE